MGGTGAIVRGLVNLLQERGIALRCNAPVTQIRIENGRACGVELQDGEFVAAAFRSIFALGTRAEVEARWDEVTDTLAERFPKAAESMRRARGDVLAFCAFPAAHWRKIWSRAACRVTVLKARRLPPARARRCRW
mgnify:CR=1 FL=1